MTKFLPIHDQVYPKPAKNPEFVWCMVCVERAHDGNTVTNCQHCLGSRSIPYRTVLEEALNREYVADIRDDY